MARTTLGLIAVFALIAAACVAFGAYFSYVTLLNAHRSVIEARFGIAAERAADVAEQAASLGIALPAQSTLTSLLDREARVEPAIRSMDLADEHGIVLFSSDPARVGMAEAQDGGRGLTRPVRNDLNEVIGHVVVRYDPQILAAGAAALGEDLKVIALPALIGAGVATVVIGLLLAALLRRAVRRASDPRGWPPAARAALAAADSIHREAAGGSRGGNLSLGKSTSGKSPSGKSPSGKPPSGPAESRRRA
ncbi:hypothetical protein V5F31_20660 [Xanthobacter sp. V7C-4]|uniref:hypothetical protein n=1 Tax=Xanthobacter autotrophicus (strain ATCC BAA-1158 / Py2) TaxID=78245 RepID=UPI003726A97F